jgi:hypothetical protein
VYNNKCKGNAYTPDGGHTKNTWAQLGDDGKTLLAPDRREMHPPLTKPEVERMTGLYQWWRGVQSGAINMAQPNNITYIDEPRNGHKPRASTSSEGGGGMGKLCTLGDLEVGMFGDVICKVSLLSSICCHELNTSSVDHVRRYQHWRGSSSAIRTLRI